MWTTTDVCHYKRLVEACTVLALAHVSWLYVEPFACYKSFQKLGAEPTTLPISVFIKEILNRNPIIADWILTGENKFQKIEKMGKSYKSGEPFYQVLWQEVVFDLSSFVKVRKMFQLLRKTKGSKLKSLICWKI